MPIFLDSIFPLLPVQLHVIVIIIYIVERNACPGGPLNRVGHVEVWR